MTTEPAVEGQPTAAEDLRPVGPAWLQRIGYLLVPERNPGGFVYGTITVGAVLAAESVAHTRLAEAAAGVLITLVLYWLAHGYSTYLGWRLTSDGTVSGFRLLARAMREEWAMLKGATVPLVVLVALMLAGVQGEQALTAALWTSAGMLFLFELAAGARLGLRGWSLVGQVGVSAIFGVGIVVLRIVLA